MRSISLSDGDTVDRSGGHCDKWNELEGQIQQELHAYAEFQKVKFKDMVCRAGATMVRGGKVNRWEKMLVKVHKISVSKAKKYLVNHPYNVDYC